MNKKQAKGLFEKYVRNECSPQEIELLHNYLDSFQNYDELWSELNYNEKIKEQLWSKIKTAAGIKQTKKEKPFIFRKYYKYVAVLIGLAGLFLWYQSANSEVEANQGYVADDAIILKTSGNKLTKINNDHEQTVFDANGEIVGKQSGTEINYVANEEIKELVYNEIMVPNGKQFSLNLSDGSSIQMNSGSSLKYPINFISGKDRRVYLKGEAYFEVTKDANNPFFVSTEEMEIKVLGTHFNVSSYESSDTFAVLEEGSVAVYDNRNPDINFKTIQPGEKAMILDKAIDVTRVNLNDYLGWREGLLVFNNETFKNIIKKIERHYGVTIENEFQALANVRFRGSFKEETITDLLDTFKESARFKYTFDTNKIIIKPMKE